MSAFKWLQGLSGILNDFPRKMFMPVIELKAAYAMKQFTI